MGRKISGLMIQKYEHFLRMEEKSENTIAKYTRDVKLLFRFLGTEDMDKSMALKFKADLISRYEIASANSIIAAVNSFFRYVGWSDCCIKQYKFQKRLFCAKERELSKSEYIRLVKTANTAGNERLSMILQTICGTGIRISELEYITVEAVKKGKAIVSCKSKTRTVFIVRELQNKLLQYIKKKKITTGSIFITRSGKKLNRSNIWREMKSLCTKANVSPDKVFPHNLRHLFAHVFYNIERDIAKLADILGHSSINTTRIYIITTGEEHMKLMERMNLIT